MSLIPPLTLLMTALSSAAVLAARICLIKSLNLIGAGSLTWIEKSRIDTKHQTFVHLFHSIFDHLAGVVDHVQHLSGVRHDDARSVSAPVGQAQVLGLAREATEVTKEAGRDH